MAVHVVCRTPLPIVGILVTGVDKLVSLFTKLWPTDIQVLCQGPGKP